MILYFVILIVNPSFHNYFIDGMASNSLGGGSSRGLMKPVEENTFDLLLKEAQAKLRKRKV